MVEYNRFAFPFAFGLWFFHGKCAIGTFQKMLSFAPFTLKQFVRFFSIADIRLTTCKVAFFPWARLSLRG